jgi:glycosyltransferase involved in cell wall biosynthesis
MRGAQAVGHPERGIPRWIAHFAGALLDRPDAAELHAIVDPGRPLPAHAARIAARGSLLGWEQSDRLTGPLVHHIGSAFEFDWKRHELLPTALRRPGVARVATLYDVIPLLQALPDETWVQRLWRHRADLVRSADAVLCISQWTAEEGIRHLQLDERRITVVGTGVPEVEHPRRNGRMPAPPLPGLESDFVLYTGGAEHPRKNLPALLRAFGRLDEPVRRSHQLVIASRMSDPLRCELTAVARDAGVEDRVLLAGYVPDDVLRMLYLSCCCVAYPSVYEGFGLPIAEAMSHGAPVVTSRTTSCREVVGHPAAQFDPVDEGSIASVLQRVLVEPALAGELREHGLERAREYRWERVAERSLEAYEDALARRRARRVGPAREAVAFAGPAGIEDHMPRARFEAVVEAARAMTRVRPVDSGRAGDPTPAALDWLSGPLVVAADSPLALSRAAELLARHPGVAVLWELDRAMPGEPPDALARLLEVARGIVVGTPLDAARLALAAGRRPVPPVHVVPVPLVARTLPDASRNGGVVVAPRAPGLPPFDDAEVERARLVSEALAARGPVELRLAGGDPYLRPRRDVRHDPWPGWEEACAGADLLLDLGGASATAGDAIADAGRELGIPVASFRPPSGEADGVHRLGEAATATEAAGALATLVDGAATVPEAPASRAPAAVARALLAAAGVELGAPEK